MILAKIELWFSRRNVEKAMAKISPIYFARSPVSILSATKFTESLPSRGQRATSYGAAQAVLVTIVPHRGVVDAIYHLVLLIVVTSLPHCPPPLSIRTLYCWSSSRL